MHLETYAAADARKLCGHYDRWGGDLKKAAKREQIEPSLTRLNYDLAPSKGMPLEQYCAGRIAYYKGLGAKLTEHSRPICDMIVTLPKQLPDERAAEFFEACYAYLLEQMGGREEDVICAAIHLDEPRAQPHMHFCFVQATSKPKMTNDKSQPLKWTKADEKRNEKHKAGTQKKDSKGTPKYKRVPVLDANGKPVMAWSLSPSAVWSWAKLLTFHKDMDKAVGAKLGMPNGCGLRLDENDARAKLSELDHDEYERVTKAKAAAEREAAEAERAAEVAKAEERAAAERLECVRQAEQAGPVELARAATDGNAAAEQRAEEAEARRLDGEIKAAETRVRDLEEARERAAGRVRAIRAGRDGLARRLDAAARDVQRAGRALLAALPHLASREGTANSVGIVTRLAAGVSALARRAAAFYGGVRPLENMADALGADAQKCDCVAAVADDQCLIHVREFGVPGLRFLPTGLDARTGKTDEEAMTAARVRVDEGRARVTALRSCSTSDLDDRAIRSANALASTKREWNALMRAFGYALAPAVGGRRVVANAKAGGRPFLVTPYPRGAFGNGGGPGKLPKRAIIVYRRQHAEVGRERAIEQVASCVAKMENQTAPEDLERVKDGRAAVSFARKIGAWDYWKPAEKQEAARAARHRKRLRIADMEIAEKVKTGRRLDEWERARLTPKQAEEWQAARRRRLASNNADDSSSSGSRGGSSTSAPSRGRSR